MDKEPSSDELWQISNIRYDHVFNNPPDPPLKGSCSIISLFVFVFVMDVAKKRCKYGGNRSTEEQGRYRLLIKTKTV